MLDPEFFAAGRGSGARFIAIGKALVHRRCRGTVMHVQCRSQPSAVPELHRLAGRTSMRAQIVVASALALLVAALAATGATTPPDRDDDSQWVRAARDYASTRFSPLAHSTASPCGRSSRGRRTRPTI